MIENLNPFFILGNPRSGTSLLRIVLNHHDQTSFPPECGLIHWLYPKYSNFNLNHDVEPFLDDLLIARKIEGWDLSRKELYTFIMDTAPINYAQLCAVVYIHYGLKAKKEVSVWGDKNNYYIDHLETLNEIYPNAQYIWIIRDVRDVFLSYKKLKGMQSTSPYVPVLSVEPHEVAKQWIENEAKVMQFFKKYSLRYNIIRYEDLITEPEKELNHLFHFMELMGSGKDLMDNYQERKYFDEPKITMDWKQKTFDGLFDRNNQGKFRSQLSKEEIQILERIAFEVMNKYQYL